MQIIMIAGNVGKDAVLRRTQSGDAVLGFSVAVNNGKDANGNKRESVWYDCSVWGNRAEALAQYITKGTKLAITGRPTARAHDGKAYLGISVNELTIQGGGSDSGQRGGNQGGGGYDQGGGYGGGSSSGGDGGGYGGGRDLDDEIPF